MNYISAAEAAQRLGVTIRAVQKWAKDGKIAGAKKVGRDWQIPEEFSPDNTDNEAFITGITLPLLSGTFIPGGHEEFIEALPSEDLKIIAKSEYLFLSGKSEEAARMAEPYLDNPNHHLKFSAAFLCTFANLSRGHKQLAHFAADNVLDELEEITKSDVAPELLAVGTLVANASQVFLHLPPQKSTEPLEKYLKYLPDGLRLYGCYVLARKAHIEKRYEYALGLASTALACCPQVPPVAGTYLLLMTAVCLMELKRTEDAKNCLKYAWDLSHPDNIITPFSTLHGLLHGLLEIYLKKEHPQDFTNIMNATDKFNTGWRRAHNYYSGHSVTDELTTNEFTIAMLYNRGWRAKEIADHMELSERTVKNYIQIIYEKLHISGKKELNQYLLQ